MDRETFDRLVLEHLAGAQKFAIRLCGNVSDAEDVMQDALLRAHRRWSTFRGDSKFKTWLFQIVINCSHDFAARHAQSRRLGDDFDGKDASACEPQQLLQGRELGELIAMEVSKLPPRQREVLVLSAYERLSNAEIAALLGLNEQNVRTTLHLARERLKQRLDKYIGQRT